MDNTSLEVRQQAMTLQPLPFEYKAGERSYSTWVEGLEDEGQPVELSERRYNAEILECRRATKNLAIMDAGKNLATRSGATAQEAMASGLEALRLALAAEDVGAA